MIIGTDASTTGDLVAAAVSTAEVQGQVLTEDPGKCTRPFVQNVDKSVKYHSSPQKVSLSFVESVFQRKETIAETDSRQV